MPKSFLEKWTKASIEATKLKFDLENLLTNNFSPEDKQSKKYQQLLEVVDNYIEHVMGDFHKEKYNKQLEEKNREIERLQKIIKENEDNSDKIKKENSFWSLKNTTIAGIGAILLEMIKIIISAIQYIITGA